MAGESPSNRSPMTQLNFRMSFLKIPEVVYFLQNASLPGLGFPTTPDMATPFKDVPQSGDKLEYDDLVLKFLVDEDLKSWEVLHNWLVGLGFPESFDQYADMIRKDTVEGRAISPIQQLKKGISGVRPPSDATLFILNSDNAPMMEVTFQDVLPIRISGLSYETDANEQQYLTATATFKYTIFKMRRLKG